MSRRERDVEETALASRLLDWYDRHRRHLPWRAAPGTRPDPYRVWLSEIMLQQTTVATVGPYFARFLDRFPSVAALAAADLDTVLSLWQGLGYYARARNLHRAAGVVARSHGGAFPDTAEGLRALPGIGEYTAGAIAAIAFDRREAAVDGNVERVMARLHAVETPLPAAKPALRAFTRALVPAARAGDFAQALMDLGATVCTPRAPLCLTCPWTQACEARKRGIAADLPRKSPKRARPQRHGIAYVMVDRDGAVLLRRRPERGLLGGMMEVPTGAWSEQPPTSREAAAAAPAPAEWRVLAEPVRHTFTHFDLALTVWVAVCTKRPSASGLWCPREGIAAQALPTVMRKVLRHAAAGGPDSGAKPGRSAKKKRPAAKGGPGKFGRLEGSEPVVSTGEVAAQRRKRRRPDG
ncbi:MAG: A/G-specific adenine glycosylase [Rhodospirillaceae bacterium]|nr:A/G-specific adenine glycosylase [Rhodospirillaceae bacterium]